MRIISGKYGRRRFDVPRSFKARPTTDFAKENLFNVLENRLDWGEVRALDLFAGTGSIGFEMLSRGASRVTAVEADFQHVSFIKKVAALLSDPAYGVIRMDVFKYIATAPSSLSYDLIFADPPYALSELETLPTLILEGGLLAPSGLLILEHPKSYDFSLSPGFQENRHYGSVNFSFFSR